MDFGLLSIGQTYTRDELADFWRYASRQAIARFGYKYH